MEFKTVWKGAGWYELGTAKPMRKHDAEWFAGEGELRSRLSELEGEGAYGAYCGNGGEPDPDAWWLSIAELGPKPLDYGMPRPEPRYAEGSNTAWQGPGWYGMVTSRPRAYVGCRWFDDEDELRAVEGAHRGEGFHGMLYGKGLGPDADWFEFAKSQPAIGYLPAFKGTFLGGSFDEHVLEGASAHELIHDVHLLESSDNEEARLWANSAKRELDRRDERARQMRGSAPELFDEDSEWVSATEASKMLGVNRQRVHQLIKSGKLDARKVGRSWIVRRSSVEERVENAPDPKGGRPKRKTDES